MKHQRMLADGGHPFVLYYSSNCQGGIQPGKGRTLGAARPQTRARGMIPLDPQLAIPLAGQAGASPPETLGRRSVCGFCPSESREQSTRRNQAFSLGIIPAFPGCFASGRLSAAGAEAFRRLPSSGAGRQLRNSSPHTFRRAESRGRRPLARVHEGRTGPRPVPLGCFPL